MHKLFQHTSDFFFKRLLLRDLLLIIFCISFPHTDVLLAQDGETSSEMDSVYHSKFLLLPAIGSSPETGFLFGGIAVPQFKIGDAGPETRSSHILISAIYTLKSQILTSVIPDIILPKEKWMFKGIYFVNYFPESFWGVGPYTKKDNEVLVLYTQVNFEQAVMRQVKPGIFLGPSLRWSKLYNIKYENTDGDRIAPPNVRGSGGNTSVGAGLIARLDQRNSNMTPTRNHFLEVSVLTNPSWLGSTDPYTMYKLDLRKYYGLQGDVNSVLALQSVIELTTGHPPFNDMALLGGDMISRGYYQGRYRDQNAAQLQVELRQHAYGRLGFTLFAGSGEVWDRFENLSFSNYKWSAGAGLRFNLNPQDPTNIRVDFGIGKNTSGFYLQFGEAF